MGTSGNGAYRVALLQLPYLYNFLNARSPSVTNVPLAAGYLKANARRVGILEDGVEIEILDPIEADRAGHGRLVERILSLEPDMVGFSVYEWNAHQSFDIARTLKERRPGVVIVVGGPEIIPNSQEVHFNHHRELDVGVMGDGETTFVELVDHYRGRGKSLSEIAGIVYRAADGGIHANPLRTEPESYREIESPYLLGYLDTEAFGFLLMETERGCPFKCAYCNWSGTKRNVFSFDRLKGEIDHARERGIEAVHFLDPTFNTSRNGRELLKYIRKVNEDRSMTFYANVYAELLKEPQIDDLVEANFKHLTAGLQSVNPVALNNINRKNNLPKFVDRVHRLIERGIFVYIDIILGLPGDDLDWVRKTLRFITDNGLEAYSRYNILTVNPDSAL
ncbi:MAG: B12-binding domain-containing radical SAM protein, partial [Planctomycetota bacterium]